MSDSITPAKKKGDKKVSTRNYKNKLLTKSSPFAITESFKKLRTNILYAVPGVKCPVVGITSAYQETGKSIIAANLAISFSQLGKKAIILDCDLRKPAQHRIFDLDNKEGISELLAGIKNFDDREKLECRIHDYDNLCVVTSGAIPPNPAELLASENMAKAVSLLREKFDFVIIDLPPINIVTDASVVSNIVDGFLFVVRLDHDDTHSVEEGIDSLEQTDSKILGIVVNDINPKTGRNYYSKYGSRYGYKKYRYKKSYYSYYNSYDLASGNSKKNTGGNEEEGETKAGED